MSEHDEWIEQVAQVLREPVRLDPSFDRRVMDEVARGPAPGAGFRVLELRRRFGGRLTLVSPIGGAVLAAAVIVGVMIGRSWLAPGDSFGPVSTPVATTVGMAPVQFVIVVPGASSVTLVGDFNDWSRTATPMEPAPGDGVWSVTVPLQSGRYRYAFFVDGNRWLTDPSAPRSLDDDFGPPNSVVTVGAT